MKALAFDPGAQCGWTAAQQLVPGQRPNALGIGVLDRGLEVGRDDRVAEAFDILSRFQPDVVFVETVHFVVAKKGIGARMAGYLTQTATLGGRLYQLAQDHGFAVAEVTAERWRQAIVSNARAENDDIKRVVLVRYANWPRRTNNHERDSGGLCAFGLEAALMHMHRTRCSSFTSDTLKAAVEALS